jgi:hypothetical protein
MQKSTDKRVENRVDLAYLFAFGLFLLAHMALRFCR